MVLFHTLYILIYATVISDWSANERVNWIGALTPTLLIFTWGIALKVKLIAEELPVGISSFHAFEVPSKPLRVEYTVESNKNVKSKLPKFLRPGMYL